MRRSGGVERERRKELARQVHGEEWLAEQRAWDGCWLKRKKEVLKQGCKQEQQLLASWRRSVVDLETVDWKREMRKRMRGMRRKRPKKCME
jgi:hypothetical protein